MSSLVLTLTLALALALILAFILALPSAQVTRTALARATKSAEKERWEYDDAKRKNDDFRAIRMEEEAIAAEAALEVAKAEAVAPEEHYALMAAEAEAVKAAAQHVVGTNGEDGWAEAMQRYVLDRL